VCPKISCLVARNLRFDVVFLFCSFFLQTLAVIVVILHLSTVTGFGWFFYYL
ncbi:hypothetical protein L9F63_021515, partial [Diploptera punctata]